MTLRAIKQPPYRRRRFTVAEYDRMAEVGILTEDNRVELIDGEIIRAPGPHPGAQAVTATFRRRVRALGKTGSSLVIISRTAGRPSSVVLIPRRIAATTSPGCSTRSA